MIRTQSISLLCLGPVVKPIDGLSILILVKHINSESCFIVNVNKMCWQIIISVYPSESQDIKSEITEQNLLVIEDVNADDCINRNIPRFTRRKNPFVRRFPSARIIA